MKRLLGWYDMAACLLFVAFALVAGERGPAWYVGACLCAVSVPLWCVARWQLGGSFSVTAQARGLVTSGLYSRLRHPIYVFGSLAIFGAPLALLGWRAWTLGVVLVIVEALRARREDRVLAETFGDEYARYREISWF